MKRKCLIILMGIIVVIVFAFPQTVCDAAKEGLLLWFEVVMPALLPFLILSYVILGMGISDSVSRFLAPLFCRLFGISKAGCYPLMIGMLSGYPVGAAAVAQSYERGLLSKTEAQRILHFCNNASPMFLVEYVGSLCLGYHYPLVTLCLLYASMWSVCVCDRIWLRLRGHDDKKVVLSLPAESTPRQGLIAVLDEGILHAFTTLAKIGGYIVLFSVVAGFVQEYLPVGLMTRGIISSIFEITSGLEQICVMYDQVPHSVCVVVMMLSSFGGLSSVAQTASVIGKTDLSIFRYLFAKLRQALFCGLYTWLWFCIF